jgi:hypothetical protein
VTLKTAIVSGQRLGKHVPVARQQILNNATVTRSNTSRKAVFSLCSLPRWYKQGTKSVLLSNEADNSLSRCQFWFLKMGPDYWKNTKEICFHFFVNYTNSSRADRSGCAVWDMNSLRPLEHWDRGFESHSRDGYLFAFILCLCEGSGLPTSWSSDQGVLPTVLD